MVPLHMISDVTVSPAHRRRGLLRRMMVDDLAQATAPVAALTVSEASIYGRFGFGPATFRRRIEVDTTARFALRDFVDPGRVELVEPADLWDTASDLFDRFHASSRGSVERGRTSTAPGRPAASTRPRAAPTTSCAAPSTSTPTSGPTATSSTSTPRARATSPPPSPPSC